MHIAASPQAGSNYPADVLLMSGGLGSFCAAVRMLDEGRAPICLFTDTLVEDADLYRFLDDCKAALVPLGASFVRIADGRTPWQVFRDERRLGSSRADPCSKILKRAMTAKWLEENAQRGRTVVSVGIDWSEEHRFKKFRRRYGAQGWETRAPLCEPPIYGGRREAQATLDRFGIRIPRLYPLGFAHNNCGGGCVKGGIGHWLHVLRTLPALYAEWEREEEAVRLFLGKDVAMLADRRGGGKRRPLTLRALRLRHEAGEQFDLFDIGGCGCFADDDEEDEDEDEDEG